MKLVPPDGYGLPLLFGEFHPRGVEVRVEFALDGESGRGRSVGDEVDDGLVGFQRPSPPVDGDSGEEPVLDLVPFAGAGWVMADRDLKAGGSGQLGEFVLPQPWPVSIRSATVSGNKQPPGIGILLLAHLVPPCGD